MTAPEQMRACPFCGSVPQLRKREAPYPNAAGIGCENIDCLLSVWSRWWKTEAEAIAAWNTRPATDELVEALEKIEAFAAPGQEMSLAVAIDALCDCWNVARTALRNTGAVS